MLMYGYEKVIVIELKDNWDLAMRPGGEIIRIRKKEGLHIGDVIYILPEDILSQKKDNAILFCAAGQTAASQNSDPPKKKKSSHQTKLLLRQLASVAAIFALCFSVLLFGQQLPVQVYAVASFDADQSLQVELDENLRILSVHSVDGSIPEHMLSALKGQLLQDAESELQFLVGDGPCLMGYAPQKGEADPWTELQLRALFSDRKVLLLTGTAEDIPAAKENALSLGQYIAGHHLPSPDQGVLDDLDGLNSAELEQMLDLLMDTPHWTEKPDFREAVKDLQEDLAERREEESEKDSEDDEDRDDSEEPKNPEPDTDSDTENEDDTPDDVPPEATPSEPEVPSSTDSPDSSETEDDDSDQDAEAADAAEPNAEPTPASPPSDDTEDDD